MVKAPPCPIKHVGSFTLLFFLSVLRPVAIWPDVQLSFTPITVAAIFLLLLYKINTTIGFSTFWQKYKVELSLVFAYQALCLISLFFNQYRYNDMAEFIRWGVTPIVVLGAFPAAIFLFLLPQNERGKSLSRLKHSWIIPYSIMMLVAWMAIWQFIDNQSAFTFYKYFVAGDIQNDPNIRSILAIKTDLGSLAAIMAISSAFLTVSFFKRKKTILVILLIVLSLSSFGAGVISGARIFILMTGISAIVTILIYLRHSVRLQFASVLLLCAFFLLVIQLLHHNTATKLALFMPFIEPFNLGKPLSPSDFIPNLTLDSFTGRAVIWRQAFTQIINHPVLGISNGGFRLAVELAGGTRVSNSHNIALQSLVDCGIGGLCLLLALWMRLLKQLAAETASVILFITISVGLMVDNFTDHSLPWILMSAYISCSLYTLRTRIKTNLVSSDPTPSHADHSLTKKILYATALILVIAGTYQGYKRWRYHHLNAGLQIFNENMSEFSFTRPVIGTVNQQRPKLKAGILRQV